MTEVVAVISGELVATPQRKFRHQIPAAHKASLDTRVRWLWHQRFGTVQQVWKNSTDMLDHTAATLILQAIMGPDLQSIEMIFQRIEGAAIVDEDLMERVEQMKL